MFNKKLFLGFLLAALVLAMIYASVSIWWTNTYNVIDLDGVEIREYEGKDLSSINHFRENSIRGLSLICLFRS